MRVRCRWRAIRRARRRGKIRVKGRPQPGFRPRKEEKSGDALRVLIEEETPSQVDGFRLGGSGTPARGAVRFRATDCKATTSSSCFLRTQRKPKRKAGNPPSLKLPPTLKLRRTSWWTGRKRWRVTRGDIVGVGRSKGREGYHSEPPDVVSYEFKGAAGAWSEGRGVAGPWAGGSKTPSPLALCHLHKRQHPRTRQGSGVRRSIGRSSAARFVKGVKNSLSGLGGGWRMYGYKPPKSNHQAVPGRIPSPDRRFRSWGADDP
jgi:hypothetical protein